MGKQGSMGVTGIARICGGIKRAKIRKPKHLNEAKG
jgi:hypothetical protein